MKAPDRDVLPTVLAPGDPCSGDEALYDVGDFANGQAFRMTLDRRGWVHADRRFHELYLEVLAGRRPFADPELRRVGRALGADWPRWHDLRPPRAAAMVLPDELLADVVEDLAPDVAMILERVLGDDRWPAPVGAAAALAYVRCGAEGRRPLEIWDDESDDRPPILAARVIDAAPPMVWSGGRPLLPLAPAWTPPGVPDGAYVARAYRVGDGWALSGVVPLEAEPARGPLIKRLTLELWRLRRHERRATWEDVLRRRPEVLYRAAAEGARRARLDAASREPGAVSG